MNYDFYGVERADYRKPVFRHVEVQVDDWCVSGRQSDSINVMTHPFVKALKSENRRKCASCGRSRPQRKLRQTNKGAWICRS